MNDVAGIKKRIQLSVIDSLTMFVHSKFRIIVSPKIVGLLSFTILSSTNMRKHFPLENLFGIPAIQMDSSSKNLRNTKASALNSKNFPT